MTDDDQGPAIEDPPPPALPQRGALGAWWGQGARTAFFLKPDWAGLPVTPILLAILVLAPMVLSLLVQRLYIDGPARFYWPAVQMGWLGTVAIAWLCWWLLGERRIHAGHEPPGAAALFAMVSAQALTIFIVVSLVFVPMVRSGVTTSGTAGHRLWWAAWLAAMAWILAAQARLMWRSTGVGPARKAVAGAGLAAVLALSQWIQPFSFWYPERPPEADAAFEPFRLTPEMAELQPDLMARRLQALAPERPGVVDVYAITFAPYADEDVFRRESALVDRVIQERFDAAGRTIQLVNHRDTVREWPWATRSHLQRAIQRAAEVMNRDEDVLFIHLTSHGARGGRLSAEFEPLSIDPLTPELLRGWLDEAGIRYRVISVSACYSGSWIEPLAGSGTLVMTAADSDHTSYGCGRHSELTYFGRAVYDEELRRTWSFEKAHAAARVVIEQRERAAGKTDGYSNPQIRVGDAIRGRLARLEAERAAAAR